jgi:hypothetical protein
MMSFFFHPFPQFYTGTILVHTITPNYRMCQPSLIWFQYYFYLAGSKHLITVVQLFEVIPEPLSSVVDP